MNASTPNTDRPWPFDPLALDVGPGTAALVVVDLQRWCADPESGIGPAIKAMSADNGRYYFDRVAAEVVPNTRRLLDAWRSVSGDVVYIVSGSSAIDGSDLLPRIRRRRAEMQAMFGVSGIYPEGSPERELLPGLEPEPGDAVLNKVTTSAFNSTGIDMVLRNRGLRTVVLCGVVTNVCVEATARDAADRGFGVVLVDDACAAYDPASHEATMATCRRFYGTVVDAKTVAEAMTTPGSGT